MTSLLTRKASTSARGSVRTGGLSTGASRRVDACGECAEALQAVGRVGSWFVLEILMVANGRGVVLRQSLGQI
jgi:hypothetical protein